MANEMINPQYIVDEPDGMAIGVMFDLPNGDQLWSGDISRILFEAQPPDVQLAFGNDTGPFVVHAKDGEARILARACDNETAMLLCEAAAIRAAHLVE